jgi:hypothetical protein
MGAFIQEEPRRRGRPRKHREEPVEYLQKPEPVQEEIPVPPKKEIDLGYQVTTTPSPGSGVVRIVGIAGSFNERPNDSILIRNGIQTLYVTCQVKQPGPVVIGMEFDGKIVPVDGLTSTRQIIAPSDPVMVRIPVGEPGEIHTNQFFTGEMNGSIPVWTGQSILFQVEIL